MILITVFPWQSAYAAAQQDFSLELTDCWSDIIPAVMTEEWKICRKGDPALLSRFLLNLLISMDFELLIVKPDIESLNQACRKLVTVDNVLTVSFLLSWHST